MAGYENIPLTTRRSVSSQTAFQLRLFGNGIVDGFLYCAGFMPDIVAAVNYGKENDLSDAQNMESFDETLKNALKDERRIHAFLTEWMAYKLDSNPEDEFLPAKESLRRRRDDCEGFARIADRYFYLSGKQSMVVDLFYLPELDSSESKGEAWGHETKVFIQDEAWRTMDNWGLASHGTSNLANVVRNFKKEINYFEVYIGKWNMSTVELEYETPIETQKIEDNAQSKIPQMKIDWKNMMWV